MLCFLSVEDSENLIIGDRGLGKTAIAIDTIINQKEFNKKGSKLIQLFVFMLQSGKKDQILPRL